MAAPTQFGDQVIHEPRRPAQVPALEICRFNRLSAARLPFEAWIRDWKLISVEYGPSGYNLDPVCLYDRWGEILVEWPEHYMPTLAEVRDACEAAYGS